MTRWHPRCRALAVAAGAALATAGVVFPARASDLAETWGYNYYGQLGNGTTDNSASPVAVTSLSSGVTAVAGGDQYSLIVQNGALYACGYNNAGQLGNGTTSSSSRSIPVAATKLTSGVTAVAGGVEHGLAIQGGAAYAWGYNNYGDLGDGTTANSSVPVAVIGLTSGVTAVAGGEDHSLALRDGALYAWGRNYNGELGNGTTADTTSPVAVIGLTSGVTAIACGDLHSLAVQGGAVYAWGFNGYGELGNGTTTSSDVPVAVTGLSNGATAVAGGLRFSLVVRNGAVYAWGYNNDGQLGNGTTTNSTVPVAVTGLTGTITAVAAAVSSSYALAADGSIWDWGYNGDGDLGLGTSSAARYLLPQHLMAPAGCAYTSVSSDPLADHVVTTLARPSVAIGSSTTGTLLGAVAPAGSDAGGYTLQNLSLATAATTGTVQINGNLSTTVNADLIYLGLSNSTQAAALVADLDTLYGTSAASLVNTNPYPTAYQVTLALPTSAGSPDDFNFDFTTVVNAGTGGNTVGSVAVANIGVTGGTLPPAINVAAGQTYTLAANGSTGIRVTTVAGITVGAAGKLVVPGASAAANRQLVVVTAPGLSLAGTTGNWTGSVDLANNDMDMPGASLAVTTDQVRQGFAGGTWAGPGGITSSAAAADPSHLTALGVIQNNQGGSPLYTTFDTVAVGASDVLIKYTCYGDTNLDGVVNAADYTRVDAGYVNHLTGWFNGDFNYDGVVDGTDYALMDNAFNQQPQPLAALALAAVPEPASAAVLGVAIVVGGRRSRRTHR